MKIPKTIQKLLDGVEHQDTRSKTKMLSDVYKELQEVYDLGRQDGLAKAIHVLRETKKNIK